MLPRRQKQINELVRQAVSDIVETGMKSAAPGLITITNAKVSPDISVAWVDFTVIGADEIITQKYLQNAAGYIVSKMAVKIRLRSLPKLVFSPDKTAKKAARVEELLREIKQNRVEEI